MKNWKRILIYALLIIGALIMIFPFVWMILSSVKTAVEVNTTPPTFFPPIPPLKTMFMPFRKRLSSGTLSTP